MHLHLLPVLERQTGGGIVSSCLELAKAQHMNGKKVSIASTVHDSQIEGSDAELPLKAYPRIWNNPMCYAPGMKEELFKTTSVSLLHSHGLYMYSSKVATDLARTSDFKLMVHVHGILEPWILRRSVWKKAVANTLFENYKYQKARFWRALTPKEADQIREYGVKGEVVTLPNGVDITSIRQYQQSLGTEAVSGEKTLLFLGRLHEKKGLIPFLKAWCSIPPEQRNEWKLQIAGPDDGIRTQLESICKGDSGVSFEGSVFGAGKYELYQKCTAFVLPSFSEGFSMSVLEAMAFGKTVWITEECNFHEAYDFGACHLSSDPSSWRSELLRFFQINEQELAQRGAELQQLLLRKYTWDKVVHQIDQLL